jgi:hypothetical protein
MLTVKPISGKLNIKSDVTPTRIDPYLIIKYGGNWTITGVSKNTDKYPYWTDTFSFIHSGDNTLFIECWNYNIENVEDGKELLGEGKAELKFQDQTNKSLYWATIYQNDKSSGEILIEVEYIPNMKKTPSKSQLNTPSKNDINDKSGRKKYDEPSSVEKDMRNQSDKKNLTSEDIRMLGVNDINGPTALYGGEISQKFVPPQFRSGPGSNFQQIPPMGQYPHGHNFPPPSFMGGAAHVHPPSHLGFPPQNPSPFGGSNLPFHQQFHPGRPGPSPMFHPAPGAR